MVNFDPNKLDPRRLIPSVSIESLRARVSGVFHGADKLASDLRHQIQNQIHPNTIRDENISTAFRISDAKDEIHSAATNVVILRHSALDQSSESTQHMVAVLSEHLGKGNVISGYLEYDPYKQGGRIAAALVDPKVGLSDINASFAIDRWTQTMAKHFMALTGARDVVVGFQTIVPADQEDFPSKNRFPHINGFRSHDRNIIPVKSLAILYGGGLEVAKESGVTRGRLYTYCNEMLDRREDFEKLERKRQFDHAEVKKLKDRYLEIATSDCGVKEESFIAVPALTGIWLKGEALHRTNRGECEPYGAGADNGFGSRNGVVMRTNNQHAPMVVIRVTERRYAAGLYKDAGLLK